MISLEFDGACFWGGVFDF